MFICHLLHKSVHFFLQNKSTLVNVTDAIDHIVYYMQEKKEIEQNFFKHTTFSLAYE